MLETPDDDTSPSFAIEIGFASMRSLPTAIFQVGEEGEITLRLRGWLPNFSYPRTSVGEYDSVLVEIIDVLDTNRVYLEREQASQLRIRITEQPLTAQNLTTIISALTELSTKYWLIAKERFADLIEYTQTHNGQFAEEANILVTRVSYNSPFNMDWKVDLSAPSVVEALVKTIDGIKQRNARLEQTELENQKKVQEIKHAEQMSAHEQQMAVLEIDWLISRSRCGWLRTVFVNSRCVSSTQTWVTHTGQHLAVTLAESPLLHCFRVSLEKRKEKVFHLQSLKTFRFARCFLEKE